MNGKLPGHETSWFTHLCWSGEWAAKVNELSLLREMNSFWKSGKML